MRMRVVPDLMAAADDLRHQLRKTRGALPDEKERGLRAVAIEQVEDARRVVGVGAVVDRQPDFQSGGFEMREDRAESPGRRDETVIEDQQIRCKEQAAAASRQPETSHSPIAAIFPARESRNINRSIPPGIWARTPRWQTRISSRARSAESAAAGLP